MPENTTPSEGVKFTGYKTIDHKEITSITGEPKRSNSVHLRRKGRSSQLRIPEGADETPLLSAPFRKGREGMAVRKAYGRGRTVASARKCRLNTAFVGTFCGGMKWIS